MRIGIDLGGTKVEGVALSGNGTIAERIRMPSPRGDYRETINAIKELVSLLEIKTGAGSSVGIGIPGTVSSHTNLVKNANSTWTSPWRRETRTRTLPWLKRPVH